MYRMSERETFNPLSEDMRVTERVHPHLMSGSTVLFKKQHYKRWCRELCCLFLTCFVFLCSFVLSFQCILLIYNCTSNADTCCYKKDLLGYTYSFPFSCVWPVQVRSHRSIILFVIFAWSSWCNVSIMLSSIVMGS